MGYKIITVGPLHDYSTKFSSYESLVNYLSKFNDNPRFGCNVILDNADKGDNELRKVILTDCNNIKRVELVPCSFNYRIVNAAGKNIYSDQLVSDVLSHVYVRKKAYSRWARRYLIKTPFKYRYDPVPNVHKLSGGHYYRVFSHVRDLRLAADPEIEGLIRPARNTRNLPNPYDLEKVRDYQKNWKSQGKYRKQWEHNLFGRGNIDTVKVFNKRHQNNDDSLDEIEEDIA